MARQLLPIELTFSTGSTLYAVVHGVVGGFRVVWNPTLNAGDGAWDIFNGANWAQYAVALTEDAGSGYYAGAYPVNIADVLTSEAVYIRAGGSPAIGDTPATNLLHSQGDNAAGVGADPVAALNLQRALVSEQRGVAAGTPTASVVATDLQSTQANAYAGRVCVFTSGAAAQCAARIVAYAVTNGVLTFAAPLPVAPAAADEFVII